WFLLGLLAVPLLYGSMTTPQIDLSANTGFLLIAGVLVGFGTRLGSGCTSGHGICGMSRLSKRSIVATLTFMAAGVLTVYVMRHVLGA
ncbi:MAG: YeeE/YedE family protein, partial [Acinetobacter sp.]|nr:YeeE/YedE family protein [Acinetobacter sp.]